MVTTKLKLEIDPLQQLIQRIEGNVSGLSIKCYKRFTEDAIHVFVSLKNESSPKIWSLNKIISFEVLANYAGGTELDLIGNTIWNMIYDLKNAIAIGDEAYANKIAPPMIMPPYSAVDIKPSKFYNYKPVDAPSEVFKVKGTRTLMKPFDIDEPISPTISIEPSDYVDIGKVIILKPIDQKTADELRNAIRNEIQYIDYDKGTFDPGVPNKSPTSTRKGLDAAKPKAPELLVEPPKYRRSISFEDDE